MPRQEVVKGQTFFEMCLDRLGLPSSGSLCGHVSCGGDLRSRGPWREEEEEHAPGREGHRKARS